MGYDAFSHEVLSKTTCVFIMVSIFFIFLAGSGTGVIALSVILISYFLLFWKAHPYVKAAVFPVALLIPILVFANMVLLTGRHDIFKSVQGRINVFTNLMSTSSVKDVLIGKGLGIGSNAALSFLKLDPIAVQGAKMLFVADTLLTSVISQTGVLFLLLFVAFNAYLLMRVINGKYQGANPIALLAIPCAAVASLGSNVIELYPVNWLLFIVYGLAMKRSGKILR
jgi:hypothetical protein